MDKSATVRLSGVFALFLSVCMLVIYRFHLGIEMTDEAYIIAEANMVLNGATPVADSWSQAPGFVLLNVPFVWLSKILHDGTSGIFLFMRSASLSVRIAMLMMACILFRKKIVPEITALWLLPLLVFAPYSIYSLSYNNWTVLSSMFAGILLVLAALSKENRFKNGLSAGAAWAVVVLCYPTQILLAACLLAGIALYEHYRKTDYRILTGYCAGGCLIGILFMVFCAVHSHGIKQFFEGIVIILHDSPYFKLSKGINACQITCFIYYVTIYFAVLAASYGLIRVPAGRREHREKLLILAAVCAILAVVGMQYMTNYEKILGPQNEYQYATMLCMQFFVIPLALFPVIKARRTEAAVLLFFIYFPSLFYCLVSSFSAYGGFNRRYYFLVNAALLVIPFLYWAIEEHFSRKLAFPAAFALSGFMCSVFLMNYYSCTYRDTPFYKNHFKISSGIYKGLYTSEKRGKALMRLEDRIRANTGPNCKVLFMDCVPFAYLMTDAIHCSPSSWDIQLYTYRFMEDTLLRKYFKITGSEPDKIIYIWTGRDKILSIDEPEYQFNKYVKKHYALKREYKDDLFPVKIFEK